MSPDETYIVKENAKREVDEDNAIRADGTISLVKLNIFGDVIQTGDNFAAIRTDVENMTIHIFKRATVSGDMPMIEKQLCQYTVGRFGLTPEDLLPAYSNFKVNKASISGVAGQPKRKQIYLL